MRLLRRSLLRDVAARRAQVVAIALTMLLGVALFGASFDAFQNLTASYQGLYLDLGFADVTAVAGDPEKVAAELASEPDVAALTTRAVADVAFDVGGHRLIGRVVGLPESGEPEVGRVRVLRGSGLDAARSNGVLIEQHLAGQFDLEPGSTFRILGDAGWREVTVLGVVASPEYLWPARSRQEVIVPFDEFGVVFASNAFAAASPPGTTHGEVLALVRPGSQDGAVERVADAAIAAGATATQTAAEQPSNAALQEDVSGFGELSLAFPLLFLGAGALAMSVLLGRLVATHRSQIGTLRATGFSRRAILVQYLGTGILVGLIGSLPGTVLGAFAAAAITGVYTSVLSIPSSVVEVRPLTLLIGLAIGPLAGALAALGPARRAASTSPAEAMRGAVPIGRGGLSVAERVIPPLRRLPTRWRVALRGLGRNRRRSLSTVLGIALATSLIFVSWAMVDTMQVLLDRQFRQIERADATVVLTAPIPASQAAAAAKVAGVAAAEPELTLRGALVSPEGRYGTTIVGLEPGTSMRSLVDSDGRAVEIAEGGVVLGVALRDSLDVRVGDRVDIELQATATADGQPRSAAVRVLGFVDEPLGTYAYTTLATAAEAAGLPAADTPVSTVLVRYAAGADGAVVRERLAGLPEVAAVLQTRSLYDTAQSFMGLFYAFIGVMLFLGGLMAFALVFNTLSANVLERAVELTALRTLGMPAATIGRMVTAENLLLTFVALVPGLAIAYLVAAAFMASFSTDLFQFSLSVRPLTFVGTAGAILLVALLSQWPALRTIARIDLARVVRERAT